MTSCWDRAARRWSGISHETTKELQGEVQRAKLTISSTFPAGTTRSATACGPTTGAASTAGTTFTGSTEEHCNVAFLRGQLGLWRDALACLRRRVVAVAVLVDIVGRLLAGANDASGRKEGGESNESTKILHGGGRKR